MAAGTIIIPIRWCAAATGWCRSTSTCRAARRPRRRSCTAFSSCSVRSAGRGPSSVAETDVEGAPTGTGTPLSTLGELGRAMAGLPGVLRAAIENGDELVLHARRDDIVALMTALRDDPRFAFEQIMELCGVDWPERAERFDIVYCLLSVVPDSRKSVTITTEETTT